MVKVIKWKRICRLFFCSVALLAICYTPHCLQMFKNIQKKTEILPLTIAELENVMKEKSVYSPVMRTFSPRIAIVEVIRAHTSLDFYRHALLSVGCYCRIWNYGFRVINSSDFLQECPHRGKFFQRHCIVARILNSFDYVLFLDSDVGVVAPYRRIEEFLDSDAEIIFYDRFFNWEVAAGAYLVKNTNWTKHFLNGFADYESRLPRSFHGSDNGAIHAYLAEVIFPSRKAELAKCLHIYEKSRNLTDLFTYEACIRRLLGNSTSFGKIKILPKGTAWVRDFWLTNSLWSPERDFMIHGWKMSRLIHYNKTPVSVLPSVYGWFNPFAGEIELSLCRSGNISWNYDRNLIAPRVLIEKRLQQYAAGVEKRRKKSLARISSFFPGNTTRR